ncbi:hypothetical protein LZ30DRAFT_596633 [Colletotrichum cereale]|nr:hypothetical protein LZ30DRAFT_596633 [Colletotrichum cereale]
MAGAFLDHRDNGRYFWSDDGPSDRPDSLRYSDDKEEIKDILHQVFWRYSSGSQRNAKNAKVKTARDGPRISDGRGGPENFIYVPGSDDEGPPPPEPSPRSATIPSFRHLAGTPEGVSVDRVMHEAQSPPANERETNEDPYQHYGSPDLSASISRPALPAWPSPFREDPPPTRAPYADMRPSTAHTKTGESSSTRTTKSKRGRKRSATLDISRSSSRKRKIRREEDQATPEQIEEALRSPERSFVAEHTLDSTEITSGTEPIGTPLKSVHGAIDNPEIATERPDAALSVITLQKTSDLREQETTRSAVSKEQLSLAKASATLANPIDSLQPPPPAIASGSSEVQGAEQGTATRRSEEKGKVPGRFPPSKPRVEFMYRVVSHHPTHESVFWIPKGHFRSKTLTDLENELPLDLDASRTEVLRLSIEAPEGRAVELVYRGREDRFDAVKQHLAGWIKDYVAKKASGDTVLVQVEIEALTDNDSLEVKTYEAAGEIDW